MKEVIDHRNTTNPGEKQLPHAKAVFILGITAVATFWLFALPGIVCGLAAFIMHRKDGRVYDAEPFLYERSMKKSEWGAVCGLLGLIFGIILLFFAAFLFYMSKITFRD